MGREETEAITTAPAATAHCVVYDDTHMCAKLKSKGSVVPLLRNNFSIRFVHIYASWEIDKYFPSPHHARRHVLVGKKSVCANVVEPRTRTKNTKIEWPKPKQNKLSNSFQPKRGATLFIAI